MSHNYIHVHAAGDCISDKRPGGAAAAGLRTTRSSMVPESENSALLLSPYVLATVSDMHYCI